jgi:hypothetical protein
MISVLKDTHLTSPHILIMAKLEDLPFLVTSDKFRRSQII